MASRWNRALARGSFAVVAVLAGCKGEPVGSSSTYSTEQFFSAIYAALPSGNVSARLIKNGAPVTGVVAAPSPTTVDGVLKTGPFPSTDGGVSGTLALASSIITGRPARLEVSAASPFTRVVFRVPGTKDYWEIDLPSAVSSIPLVATVAAQVPSSGFAIEAAVGTDAEFGAGQRVEVSAIDLANTDVAAVLRWNTLSDVDIHVIDPKGQEVYFAHTSTPEGGRLDLDSNPACRFDGVNQEIITWPAGQAPIGDYTIKVYYYSDCGQTQTDYSVAVMSHGQVAQTVTGTFTGLGSPGTSQTAATLTFP